MSTNKKVENLVEKKVNKVLRNIFSDSELNSKLSSQFVEKLKRSIRDKKEGRTMPLKEFLDKNNA